MYKLKQFAFFLLVLDILGLLNLLNILVKWLAFLLHILEVSDPNLRPNTGYQFLVLVHSSSGQILRQCIKIVYDRFRPHPL
jgi:hypothetical protein